MLSVSHITVSAFNSIITCYRHLIHGFAQGRISYRITIRNQIQWRRFKIKENSFVSDYNHETFSMYRNQNKKNIGMFYLHTYSNLHMSISNKLHLSK